jgi:glutamate:GABA antiporter
MPQAPGLKRGIRFRDLTLFYVISVLSVRGTALAAAAGPSVLVVWAAAVASFFVPLATSVMELSSRHPEEGGIYVWTRAAFGDACGFLTAWTYWMSNLSYFPSVLYFGAGSLLYTMGEKGEGLAANPLYYASFSIACLAAITLLNIVGANAGKWLNNAGAMGSLLSLGALVVLAAVSWARFGPAQHYAAASFAPHLSLQHAIFWSTVFFALSGIEAGSSMGDEIEHPRRAIPLAILAGGALLVVGYVAGTGALLSALPPVAVAGPDGFVNGVRALCARLHADWLLAPVALLVVLNAVGNAAAYLSSTSRLPFVAGIDRYLPAVFGKIHPRFRTPWVAIGVYGLAGMAMTVLGQAGMSVRGAYDILLSMTIVSFFLPYLALFGAMIRLQRRPAGPEVRCVPGGKPVAIVLACLGLASTATTIVLTVIPTEDEPDKAMAVLKVLGGTAVLVLAGAVVFVLEKRRARRSALAHG